MKNFFLTTLVTTLFLAPLLVLAQAQYEPLVDFLPDTEGSGLDGLINALYAFSITLAALLAVIKIIIAGVRWMMTDIVTSKSQAKEDIKGAVFGLLIVLSAVMILNIINPELTSVSLNLNKVQQIESGAITPGDYNECDATGPSEYDCSEHVQNCEDNYPDATIEYTSNGSSVRCVTTEQDDNNDLGGPFDCDVDTSKCPGASWSGYCPPEAYDCSDQAAKCLTEPGVEAVESPDGSEVTCSRSIEN